MSRFFKMPTVLVIFISVISIDELQTQSLLSKRQLKKAFKVFINDTLFRHSQVSFQLSEFKTNKPLLKCNEEKALIPASIFKLIPSALLLDTLGSDFQFNTPVSLVGEQQENGIFKGNLVIQGRGDPSLCSPYMEEAVQLDSIANLLFMLLQKRGIHTLTGGVQIEDSYIKDTPENTEWLYYDLGNYYGGGCQSLNFHENEISIQLAAAKAEGSICPIVREIPGGGNSNFISEVKGYSNPMDKEVFVLGNSLSPRKIIKGHWKCCDGDSLLIRAAMHDPKVYFENLLTYKLKDLGVQFLKHAEDANSQTFGQAEFICTLQSPPLHKLVQRALYRSVNLYCESFLHEIGRVWLQSTNRDSIIRAIDDSLSYKLFQNPGFEIEDGSGLSPKNFISASNMVKFLEAYQNYKNESPLWKLIPDIHNNGGLRKYLQPKRNARAALHLKSGSMERVRSYTGYLIVDQKIVATLCIIVNNFPGKSEYLQKHIAGFLDKVILTKFN